MSTAAQKMLLDRARHAYDAGNMDAARGLCEQLLAQSKRNPGALHLMGLVLSQQRRYDEAAVYLDRLVALRPKDAVSHLALGHVQTFRGKYGPALARFEKALRIDPGSRDAVSGKADVFFEKGEYGKTTKLLEPWVNKGSATPHMGLTFARGLNGLGQGDEAIAVIDRFLNEPSASLEARRQLLFLRGRILERRGDYDEAFEVFTAANAVEPGVYDPDVYRRRVDKLIEVFSVENLARLPRAGHGLDEPILIVGMPRTGSTLLERILDAHPQVRGASEATALQEIVGDLSLQIGSTAPYPGCLLELDTQDAEQAGRSYVEALRKIAGKATRIVDKNLYNFESVGLISLICPEARVIDCRRSALDTCISCFTEPLAPDGHAYASSLEHLGSRYRQYERLTDHWHRVIDRNLMQITYEELTGNQEDVSRRLLEFVGLPWDEKCLKFHESKFTTRTLSIEQVRKPIYRSSVNRSERFAAHLDPLRKREQPVEELRRRLSAVLSFLARRRIDGISARYSEI